MAKHKSANDKRKLYNFIRKAIYVIFAMQNILMCCAINNRVDWSKNQQMQEFEYCLRNTQHPSLQECAGRTAISFLQKFDEKDNYTLLQDVVSAKDEKVASARSLANLLDVDPVDFRGILENAGAVFSQRSLEWHMDGIYPGLMFKIGPTADTNSVAEFLIDPSIEHNRAIFEEPSTARVLARQYLLPFLLGLKFNLVALVPLLFAGVTLLLKKSLFFAKLAIYISSLLGIGGAVGALNSFGVGNILGFGGGLIPHPPPPLHHIRGGPLEADVNVAGGGLSHYPGKTTIFNYGHAHAQDEVFHQSPYKRTDRKVNFDKPREYSAFVAPLTTTPTTPPDRFYDYEKQVLMQDRSGKVRRPGNKGKLGPSSHFDDYSDDDELKNNFKPSQQIAWKVV